MIDYTVRYLQEVGAIAAAISPTQIDEMVTILWELRAREGRLFFLGVGGGAGHAGHAVNDFRKIAGIECYAPSDNVAELTARINDDGWDTCYANWLRGSRLSANDALFIFSVGGGSIEKNISMNLVNSLRLAREVGAKVLGVVGRDGGFTAKVADQAIIVPTLSADTVTAHAESFQAVVWHLLVSHPRLRAREMKWETAMAYRLPPHVQPRSTCDPQVLTAAAATGRKAVFLDRDGVLNQNVFYADTAAWEAPRLLSSFVLASGVVPALRALADAGYLLFLVSNQPNACNGKSPAGTLEAMHRLLVHHLLPAGLSLTAAFYCTHHPAFTGPCPCRKPSPYFLEQAGTAFGLALADCWMVGDRDTDLSCGRAAGTRTAWIATGQEAAIPEPALIDVQGFNLQAAVPKILAYDATYDHLTRNRRDMQK